MEEIVTIIYYFRCKELREKRNWTQQDLADEMQKVSGMKYNRAKISQYETGAVNDPPIELLIVMANAFGVSLGYLVGGDNYPTLNGEAIFRATGLSERAIRHLLACGNPSPSNIGSTLIAMLNNLLEDVEFSAALAYMNRYVNTAIQPPADFDDRMDAEAIYHREELEKRGLKFVTAPELARLEYEAACEKLKNVLDRIALNKGRIRNGNDNPQNE